MQKHARSKCVFALYFSAGFCIFILEPVMIDKTRVFTRETREIHEKLKPKKQVFLSFFSVFGVFRGQILIFQTTF